MKKLIYLLAFVGVIMHAEAQTMKASAVPAAVTAAFNKSHKAIKEVEWKLKDGNKYEAKFDDGKIETLVIYDDKGNLVQTRTKIAASALPAPIMTYMKKNYKEDEVKKAWKITEADGSVTYRVKAKSEDIHIFFDAKGTFLKSVRKKD